MRGQPILVRLGAEEWRVRPLTLRQIQDIEPLLAATDARAGRSIEAAIAIIAVALKRDHAEASEKLAEIEASAQEIGAAMRAILRLGGFLAAEAGREKLGDANLGDANLGKAPAGADGASSTPA